MASTRKTTGAPSGASNVVRLPNAAARQVNNWRYSAQRKAGRALKAASPFNGRYVDPSTRAGRALAEQAMAITQTPALVIVSAILHSMDSEAFAKVAAELAPAALGNNEAARQALATLRISRMNVGQQLDFFRGLDFLRGEGC